MNYSSVNITSIATICRNKKVFVIVDKNTYKFCLYKIKPIQNYAQKFCVLKIATGEVYKNIDTTTKIWGQLIHKDASKSDIIINLGGGTITDIGGFAAATYKRGIDFINIPTTLLGMIDAAIGNKNGINFLNYKNAIGTFSVPENIVIDIDFLKTLPEKQLLSGFAEIIKTALIADAKLFQQLLKTTPHNFIKKKENIFKVVNLKSTIVDRDPFEKDYRKILNFGHTFGHAFESVAITKKKKLTHGEAIAMGMICELQLSVKYAGLAKKTQQLIEQFILNNFQLIHIDPKKHSNAFINAVNHDKKNRNNNIYPVLLKDIEKPVYNIAITEKDIIESLEYYINLKNNI